MTETTEEMEACPLGEMHGVASCHTNEAGERCCDFCGQSVGRPTVPEGLVEAIMDEVVYFQPTDDYVLSGPLIARILAALSPATVPEGLVERMATAICKVIASDYRAGDALNERMMPNCRRYAEAALATLSPSHDSRLADAIESKMRARQACKREDAAEAVTYEIGLLVCGEPETILSALRASPAPDAMWEAQRNAIIEEIAAIFDVKAEEHRRAASECESDGHRNGPVWRTYQTTALLTASIIRSLRTDGGSDD